MRFRSLGALSASAGLAVLLATSAFGLTGGQSAKDRTSGQKSHVSASTYIVQLADDPAVAYEGGVAGLRRPPPRRTRRSTRTSNDVKKYVAYLNGKHASAAAAVGAEKFYDYALSFNGFAAQDERAAGGEARLAGRRGRRLEGRAAAADHLDDPDASSVSTSPARVSGRSWAARRRPARTSSSASSTRASGPSIPSFSDQKDYVFRTGESGKRNLAYGPPPAYWHGSCQSGEQFSQDMCTNKLIGARYYLSGFGHFGIFKDDYKSARDHDSHGSHTSSTAAGNYQVQATGAAAPLGKISGMAPRARIAAYKVCWNGEEGGCASSDSVAAIDQAVADGVDVINFSISGTPHQLPRPGRDRVPVRRPRGRVRRRVGRQRAVPARRRSPTPARG